MKISWLDVLSVISGSTICSGAFFQFTEQGLAGAIAVFSVCMVGQFFRAIA